jgi:putative ABC transport system permease protein
MLRVTVAGLLAHRLRLILTAAAIAIGAALVSGTFILTDSLQGALDATSSATAAARVLVQPAGAGGPEGGKTAPASASLPAGLVARVRAVPGVAFAEGLVSESKVILIGMDGRPITHARAVNELLSYPSIGALAAQYTVRFGHLPMGPGQAMLDAATARKLGYRTGDRIKVVTAAGPRTLTVVGITGFAGADSPADAQVASFDTPTVLVVQAATAQRLTGLSGRFTEIDAVAVAGTSAAPLRARIARLLPPGAEALTGEQAAAQQAFTAASYVGTLRSDLLAFCAVALLVGAFVIANTFSLLAVQRTREYALLRVIGARRGQVLRSALAEAAILGLVASAAGAGLGIAAAAGLRAVIALLGGTIPASGVVFAPRTAVVALATGTLVTLAAALRPARLAASVAPIRALREALPTAASRFRGRLAAGITGLAIAAALIAAGLESQRSQNTALAAAGALAAVAAVVTAGPLIAGPLARLLAALAAPASRSARSRRPHRGGSVAVRLARDNAAQNPRRTAATAAILTIGLAAAATVAIVASSARASASEAIDNTSHAGLYLQGSVSPGMAKTIASRPGVLATMRVDAPMVQVAGAQARIDGIDPARAALLVNFGVRTGTLAALTGNRIFVSAFQAARHGWHAGSPVAVNFGSGPPRTLRVAGIFADKRFFGDDYLMPITTLFRDMPSQQDDAGLLLIRTASKARPAAIRMAIAALLPGYSGTTLLTSTEYQSAQAANLGDLNHILGLLTALVVLIELVAALGIANTLTLSVSERTREFAILRALGLTRRQLGAVIRAESVLTCLLGALPGAAVGLLAGTVLAATMTRDQTGVATVTIPAGQLGVVLALTCIVGLLAAALPARHTARLAILEATASE